MSSDREDFVHGAVADHLAHHAFGQIAQRFLRLASAKQVHFRIGDAILDDPWHERSVEVACDHRLGFARLHIALVDIGRVRRGKTELELQETLRRHDVNLVDVRNGIGQTRVYEIMVGAEARLHTDGICGNRRETKQQGEKSGGDSYAGNQAQE